MGTKYHLTDGQRELIRWRWSQRPSIQSLADEYGVSYSCIRDILDPGLQKRYDNRTREEKRRALEKSQKKSEYEGPVGSSGAVVYPARKVNRRKG